MDKDLDGKDLDTQFFELKHYRITDRKKIWKIEDLDTQFFELQHYRITDRKSLWCLFLVSNFVKKKY